MRQSNHTVTHREVAQRLKQASKLNDVVKILRTGKSPIGFPNVQECDATKVQFIFLSPAQNNVLIT